METFSEKYISVTDKAIDAKSTKTVLSDDAYAIGEMLEKVSMQLFRVARHGS